VIWSNCDQLQVFVGARRIADPVQDRTRFPRLSHPPFLVNLTGQPREDLRIDGWVRGTKVLTRLFSPDRSLDQLALRPDDTTLTADGIDATRVALRIVDRYGAHRWFRGGIAAFSIQGPGELVGDSPISLDHSGGVAAIWLRTLRGQRGRIHCTARHSLLATKTVSIDVV
jgi:beta-galactosidase